MEGCRIKQIRNSTQKMKNLVKNMAGQEQFWNVVEELLSKQIPRTKGEEKEWTKTKEQIILKRMS